MTRRAFLFLFAALTSLRAAVGDAAETLDARRRKFVEAAFAMKLQAERSGDQPYGAVVVRDDAIVGWGPSRVVVDNDWNAHAERVALRDAQMRLGRTDLSDCVMYSTSRPCRVCEQAAAAAGLARMFHGADATDVGAPR
jgi:tRNA(Arg) A34 adenosine deaminase TadA